MQSAFALYRRRHPEHRALCGQGVTVDPLLFGTHEPVNIAALTVLRAAARETVARVA